MSLVYIISNLIFPTCPSPLISLLLCLEVEEALKLKKKKFFLFPRRRRKSGENFRRRDLLLLSRLPSLLLFYGTGRFGSRLFLAVGSDHICFKFQVSGHFLFFRTAFLSSLVILRSCLRHRRRWRRTFLRRRSSSHSLHGLFRFTYQ